MKYQKQTTSKLFYGKYPFKIRCTCKGSWMIKRLGIYETVKQCTTIKNNLVQLHKVDPTRLMSFLNDVEIFLDKDISVRCEGSIFSIYCKDETLFNQMCKRLSSWITEVHVPANDAEQAFMIENEHKKVLCNRLPFETYHYKVYIKATVPVNLRENFYKWMLNYQGKIQAPVRVGDWLSGRKMWVVNPSLYVKDAPTLSMVGMFLGDRISKVEEFVPRSLINMTKDQEQTCHHLAKV